MLFRKKEPVFDMRLEKFFDVHEATEEYRLVKYEIKNGKVQKGVYWLASGNKEWAKKIARHYNLGVTEPVFEDD